MGQQSKIDRLPEAMRTQLNDYLRDPAITQKEATARMNMLLEEIGHPEKLDKSTVNRYSLKMEKIGERLRHSREIAKMWIGKLGAEPQGEVGKLLNEIVRGLAFDAAVYAADSGEVIEPKMLKDLALAVQRLEKAAKDNTETERKIRDESKKEAAQAVEKEAKRQGASAATIDKLREAIMSEIS
ncbi:MAG: DUF3486 family protein [Candidatus Marinimicrobia bacterium]|nr:DUF3486 family protein [Candidatus Neomarinimicrobiota bacterium]